MNPDTGGERGTIGATPDLDPQAAAALSGANRP